MSMVRISMSNRRKNLSRRFVLRRHRQPMTSSGWPDSAAPSQPVSIYLFDEGLVFLRRSSTYWVRLGNDSSNNRRRRCCLSAQQCVAMANGRHHSPRDSTNSRQVPAAVESPPQSRLIGVPLSIELWIYNF